MPTVCRILFFALVAFHVAAHDNLFEQLPWYSLIGLALIVFVAALPATALDGLEQRVKKLEGWRD